MESVAIDIQKGRLKRVPKKVAPLNPANKVTVYGEIEVKQAAS